MYYIDKVDECALEIDNCSDNADCIDSEYSLMSLTGEAFKCICRSGYFGNGTTCNSKQNTKSICYVCMNYIKICTVYSVHLSSCVNGI